MMFKYLLSFLFFYSYIYISLYFLYLIQLKEYRWDRVYSHIKTSDGKRVLILIILYLLSFIGILYLQNYQEILNYILLIFIIFFSLYITYIGILHKLKRPIFTKKAIFIIFLLISISLFYSIYILYFSNIYFLYYGYIYMILSGFLIIYLIKPFQIIYINKKASKAIKKLNAIPNLKIIGITGSYGKTSVKEILYQILSDSGKNTVKTIANGNTLPALISIILNKISENTEFFIVEAGAYKKGEIKKMMSIAKPEYAIITSVSNQHLDLFGSIENIFAAKYELIESLKPNGKSLFNGDSENSLKMFNITKGNKYLCSEQKNKYFQISDIDIQTDKTKFSLTIDSKKYNFVSNILGHGNIMNLSLAISMAIILDIPIDKIQKSITNIKTIPQTLTKYSGINNSIIIADNYSTNEYGFYNALDYISKYKSKKFIITPGIIELGNQTQKVHKNLATIIKKMDGFVILTNKLAYNEFKSILQDKVMYSQNYQRIISFLKNNIKENDVVLFEGRSPNIIIENISKDNIQSKKYDN